MAMKNGPCAYCGTMTRKRERGHVLPRCIYPSGLQPSVQRITVPECEDCKKTWQDDEAHFRNVLMLAGEPNHHVTELWEGPVNRSFDKPSGPRWVNDLIEQLVPVETEDGPRHKIYPDRDPRVVLVLRKIIRGLCDHEKIETSVDGRRVFVKVMPYVLPEEFENKLTWRELGDQFFRYGFSIENDLEYDLHSFWYLTFFEWRHFIGGVSLSETGWREESKPGSLP